MSEKYQSQLTPLLDSIATIIGKNFTVYFEQKQSFASISFERKKQFVEIKGTWEVETVYLEGRGWVSSVHPLSKVLSKIGQKYSQLLEADAEDLEQGEELMYKTLASTNGHEVMRTMQKFQQDFKFLTEEVLDLREKISSLNRA